MLQILVLSIRYYYFTPTPATIQCSFLILILDHTFVHHFCFSGCYCNTVWIHRTKLIQFSSGLLTQWRCCWGVRRVRKRRNIVFQRSYSWDRFWRCGDFLRVWRTLCFVFGHSSLLEEPVNGGQRLTFSVGSSFWAVCMVRVVFP